MNKTDIKNLSLIEDMVKDHFSMRDDSFEFFKNFIYKDDCHNFPFLKEDRRLRIDLPKPQEEEVATLSNPKELSRLENFFTNALGFDYKDLLNISFEKRDSYKFLKALKFIMKQEELRVSLTVVLFQKFMNYILATSEDINKSFIKHPLKVYLGSSYEITIVLLAYEIKNYFSKERIKATTKLAYRQMVISRNFADWFLCSTSEKWTSCLNLDSEYANAYWSGLPYLAGDPNRVMIYFTDGKKKKFNGVETDKFGQRLWGILGEDNKLYLLKSYPQDYYGTDYISAIIESNFGIKVVEMNEKFVSKEAITPLFTKSNQPHFIFTDRSIIKRSLKMGFYEGSGCYQTTDGKDIYHSPPFRYEEGLSNLIKNKKELYELPKEKAVYTTNTITTTYTATATGYWVALGNN